MSADLFSNGQWWPGLKRTPLFGILFSIEHDRLLPVNGCRFMDDARDQITSTFLLDLIALWGCHDRAG